MRIPVIPKRLFVMLLAFLLFLLLGLKPPTSLADTTGGPVIRLRYAVFNPILAEPQVAVGEMSVVEAGGPATYLLQFNGPIQQEWKAAAEAAGARLYSYIPEHAFIVRMDEAVKSQVLSLPFVRWVGLYHPAYRISDALRAAANLDNTASLDVIVEALPDADLASLAAGISALGGEVLDQSVNELSSILRITLPAASVSGIASLDGVLWVEAYPQRKLFNDVGGGGVMKATQVHSILGLYGNGQIVAVADTGLDTGNPATIHPDVAGRIAQAFALGRAGDWSDFVAHGTHVVGSVLGNGTVDGSSAAAHQYDGTYAGVAPEASLVMQSIADAGGGLEGIPSDIGTLFNQAYGVGARLHTNSWGSSAAGDYTLDSRNADLFMWNHKDMLVLFAAGNDGADYYSPYGVIDPDSMGAPGTAKNVLTVGASENNRPAITSTWGSFYGSPISGDTRANNTSGMAAFSSRGPTDDGRVKPDITAPGTFIASMRTRQFVMNDNLEGSTGGYTTNYVPPSSSSTSAWSLRTDDSHTPTHSWRQVVNGSFSNQAQTFLLTPAINVRPTGGYFDVQFFQKFTLNPGDQLIVRVYDADNLSAYIGYILGDLGTLSSYNLRKLTFSIYDFFLSSSVRIGFAIRSDGSSNSTWWIDDIRVDGSDWGTLSSVGLTPAGSVIDDNYLMMGGTSMATPLTAGAAALVREWLVENRSIANPSAALMKAVLINGAADMSPGQYGTDIYREVPALRPNNVTGWGLVDLMASLRPTLPRQVWLQENNTGLSTSGASQSYNINVGWPVGSQVEPDASQGQTAGTLVQPADNLQTAPETTPRSVELKVDKFPSSVSANPETSVLAPAVPQATVSLVLDDGAHESSFSLVDDGTNPTVSYQFIWMNRFTPGAAEFPFNLEQIWVMYDDPQNVIQAGDAIDLVVYQDGDGDPANGASLLATYHTTALAVDGATWSVYNLSPALEITGPGDVLIAAINRYVNDGVTAPTYSATIDTSSNQGRSWWGYWFGIPPDPAVLPTDLYFDTYASGNWMIRGYGSTTGGTTPPEFNPLRVTLAWTDYPGAQSAARTLVNDLDLEVRAPDGTTYYYGNAGLYGTGSACLHSGNRDNCNNVEGIVIPSAAPGTYTITVRAYEISVGPQPFALVASGDNVLGTALPQVQMFLPMLNQ